MSCLHAAVDDFSRVAYAELLPDERVMTDNGPGYRSGEFNGLLESEGVRHVYTRPFSPWRNDKVERMNRTLAQERRYGRAWDDKALRPQLHQRERTRMNEGASALLHAAGELLRDGIDALASGAAARGARAAAPRTGA